MSTSLAVSREQEIVTELKSLNKTFNNASRTRVEAGVRMGELLTEVRVSVGHGNFLPWLEENCEFSQDSASLYMRAYSGKLKHVPSLPTPTSLTALAALAPSQRPATTPNPLHVAAPKPRPPTVDEILKLNAEARARNGTSLPPVEEHVSKKDALEFFGLDPLTEETVLLVTRVVLSALHPDKGGDAEAFSKAQKFSDYLRNCYE